MTTLVLYALLCSSMFYLGSRAMITSTLWSRYPLPLARFMDCPACTGFWYGLICGLTIGWFRDLNFLGLPGGWVGTPVVVGVCMIVATPLAAALMQRALQTVGSAVDTPTASYDFDGAIDSTVTRIE